MNNLDLILTDTYSVSSIGINDISKYDNYPTNVSFEITIPGYPKANITFVPKVLNIFDASVLMPWCNSTDLSIPLTPLPDGIYQVKYSVYPNDDSNTIERSFIRTYVTECKYYKTFLAVDVECACNGYYKGELKQKLRDIRLLIEGSVAAANQCDAESSLDMLRKANDLLDKLKTCNC